MENFSGRIWLVGGSARAAAGSALRAGWQPVCTDFFADSDLRRVAVVVPVGLYPAGLVELSEKLPPAPWMYTGGLENHPEIVSAISHRHTLWGNDANSLQKSRDPFHVASVLTQARLPVLDVNRDFPEDEQLWMRKPLHGSGGCGITEWRAGVDPWIPPHQATSSKDQPISYFQRNKTGEPISALFLAWPGKTQLLEVTSQLIGLAEFHTPPFHWCGNIAPAPLTEESRMLIERIGKVLAEACSLRGLFGCDFILADHTPWLTEINPRYTGSVELVEFLRQSPLLDWHRRACLMAEQGGETGRECKGLTTEIASHLNRSPRPFVGKAILYNAANGLAGDASRLISTHPTCGSLPFAADIPIPGSSLQTAQPLCSVYATGRSPAECRQKLIRRAKLMRRRLFRSTVD